MTFDDENLSLVPLHKRKEVRRRITAVKRYLADPRRPVAEREAAKLGVSIHSLHKLARAWRELGRPEALAGSGAPRKRRDHLTVQQHEILDLAAQQLPGASLTRLGEQALAIAAGRKVAMPSLDAIRANLKRRLEHRIPPNSYAIGADFAVEHCAVGLPVDDGSGRAVMPIATLVIDVDTHEVRGVVLAISGVEAASVGLAVVEAFKDGFPTGQGCRPVMAFETFSGEDWERLEVLLAELPSDIRSSRRLRPGRLNLATALLGDRHKGVWLRPRLTARPPEARVATIPKGGTLLTLEAAELYLRERWMAPPIAGEFKQGHDVLERLRAAALSSRSSGQPNKS
ncbi:MAG: hypothetical protein ACXWUZ_03750 [Allosphingosinicella sp.]